MEIATKFLTLVDSANKRGIEFNLTFTDVKRLLSITHCEATGILLEDSKELACSSAYRTVDRVDSSKGYVTGNVQAVCYGYNTMKNTLFEQGRTRGALSDMSHEDIKKVMLGLSRVHTTL